MSPMRVYCPHLALGEIVLADEEARHVLRSRRLAPGAALLLFDGRGQVGRAHLSDEPAGQSAHRPGRARVRGQRVVVEALESHAPPAYPLTLIVAACKGPRLDWLVEKCTELGVARLVFARFARSVVRLDAGHLPGLRRTAIESCKQCGRAWLPELEAGATLPAAVAGLSGDAGMGAAALSGDVVAGSPAGGPPGGDALLVAHPDSAAPLLGDWLARRGRPPRAAVVIGPEGGLTPEELALLTAAGGQPIGLGPHILRVETAALAVAAAWAMRNGMQTM